MVLNFVVNIYFSEYCSSLYLGLSSSLQKFWVLSDVKIVVCILKCFCQTLFTAHRNIRAVRLHVLLFLNFQLLDQSIF